MSERKYTIKEASELVGVEAHVLRYWEEELDMNIKRNDMGHRYYEENDVKLLKKVKELKDRGIQLKAIKELVRKMYEILENGKPAEESQEQSTKKRGQADEAESKDSADGEAEKEQQKDSSEEDFASYDFTKELMKDATQISNVKISEGRVVDFKMAQFQTMMTKIVSNSMKESIKPLSQAITANAVEDIVKQMDVIIKEKEEREEARFKKLDVTLREIQQARREIAASEASRKKKFGFKSRKK